MAANNVNITLPKNSLIKKVRVSEPTGFSSVEKDETLIDQSTNFQNASVRDLRNLDRRVAIRALSRVNGIVSAAVESYINLAMSDYSVTAYSNGTNLFDRPGTELAVSLANKMDTLNDYSEGFVDKRSISQLLETLLKEVILTGSCGGELVLDKFRLPNRIVPLSTDNIQWRVKKDKRKYPVQINTQGEDEIPLDYPTVFFEALNSDANTVYPHSMLESCLNNVYLFLEFLEDMSRVIRRSGHTRLVGTIKIQEAMASAPSEVKADPKKLQSYLISLRDAISDQLGSLEPNEAVVTFDNVEFNLLSGSGEKADYTDLLEALNGLVASSLKSMPSALGLRIGKGSQSLSNTETLLYLKSVEALRKPVESFMSRALTLSSRLAGSDTYVKFKFSPVDLRPKTEVEAHLAIRQSRILDLLSLGFMTDDEAAHMLGAGFRAEGAPELSGTLFRTGDKVDASKATPNNGAQEKALSPDTPTETRGRPEEE